jgi:hypothetical protein
MWDAYKVFYYSFIDLKTKANYWPVVVSILHDRKVSSPAKERIKEIIGQLRKKNMTRWKKRKSIIVEKVHVHV